MKSAIPFAVAAVCASLVVPAAAQPAGNACFVARNVDSFAPVDDTTVNVRAGPQQYFQLKLFAPCLDLDFTQRIAMRTRGSSWVCEGQANSVELFTHATASHQRCSVTSVRKLTPEDVAAMPRKQKP